MSISSIGITSLRGVAEIRRLVRKREGKVSPQDSLDRSSPKVIRVTSSSEESSLQSTLKRAFDLQGYSPVEKPKSLGTISQIFQLEDPDIKARSLRTSEIGDRAQGQEGAKLSPTPLLFPLAPLEETDPDRVLKDIEPTQDQISQVRASMIERAQYITSLDPQISEDDLKTSLDAYFGSGTSDLFGVQYQDAGNGKSQVVARQIQWNELSNPERETLNLAVATSEANFEASSTPRNLEGSDIQKALSDLADTLGNEGLPLIEDLKTALQSPGDLSSTLESFKSRAMEMASSENDASRIEMIFNQMDSLDQTRLESFDQNPLADSWTLKVNSNRYANAFSRNEIEEVAALTANTLFLEK